MTIDIDHIDSEIEIMPPARPPGVRTSAPAVAASAPPIVARDLRQMIRRTLEDELADYLRTRG
jgi:hypothetical protein